ncbi:NADH-quinone oxidoreductase subunit 5 family protein [Methanogenium organophilum]|uniref:Proton-conducting transporter membrane subunit n=1 Tax=Methanogenium organophilum TaxID=2199 RepID=A0A9X9S557_METOG|nr:proton-conducting transporter membrane subunit [Methanogenium organophilum]WAI02264.1 proton-conducting transporter membrane subunit [Methanogenium organophilum]
MELLVFLILFPALAALLFCILPNGRLRDTMVILVSAIIIAATLYLFVLFAGAGTVYFDIDGGMISQIMTGLEVVISAGLLYLAAKYRQYIIAALVVVQLGVVLYAESLMHGTVALNNLFIDPFSVIMAMIIGIIGSLICIYSVGYMRDYHEHHGDMPDKRRWFFALLFVFLAAMFGVVFSNSLFWLFFFWEVTTLCSFLLIGYSWDEQARKNAFWALLLNLIGGLGFAFTFVWAGLTDPSGGLVMMDTLLAAGPAVAMIPAALIGFAGLTKAAQMPFSSWLVGAMIAPTPVSALLHSSTMVKAGVYVIVRFAPIYDASMVGYIISLVGGVTFLLASGIAISQSNAKKVLAYSTIANLGLVVACAGIGTYAAVWAAILLIIFHAVAKSLLFLSVGTVEHKIGSRDIEDMTGLLGRLPKIALMMMIGIAGMFLAPFGMLISKWAALLAFLDAQYGFILILLLAFGSAVTVFFWTKWMGKLVEVAWKPEPLEVKISTQEYTALVPLTVLMVAVCIGFPLLSSYLVVPYVFGIYGMAATLGQANTIIMVMMVFMVLVMPLTLLYFRKDRKILPHYVGGRPATPDMHFKGSIGVQRPVALGNYYLSEYFGEERLSHIGNGLCIAFIAMIAVALLMGVGL